MGKRRTQYPSAALEYRIIAAYASSQTSRNSISPMNFNQLDGETIWIPHTTHNVPFEGIFKERVNTRTSACHFGRDPFLDSHCKNRESCRPMKRQHTPFQLLIVLPRRPISDLRFHSAKKA